jgi:GTPase SAR1 family protein
MSSSRAENNVDVWGEEQFVSTAYAKGFVLGDVGVGKTATIASVTNGNLRTQSETGAAVFGESTSGTLNFTYQDTSIAVTFTEVDPDSSEFSQGYFLSSLLCIICFDTRDVDTLEHVFSRWIPFKEQHMPDSYVILVGCFSDCHLQRKTEIEPVFEQIRGTDMLYLDISNTDHTNVKLLQSMICARAIEVVTLMESLPEKITAAEKAAEGLETALANEQDTAEDRAAEDDVGLVSTYSLAEFVHKMQKRSDVPAAELEAEVEKFLNTLRQESALGVAKAARMPDNEAPVATYEEIREAMAICGFKTHVAANDGSFGVGADAGAGHDEARRALPSYTQKLRLRLDEKRTVELTVDTRQEVRAQIERQLHRLRAGSDAAIVQWAALATQAVHRQMQKDQVARQLEFERSQMRAVPVARIRTSLNGQTEYIDIMSEDTPIEVLDRLEMQTGMTLTLHQRARILSQIAPYIKTTNGGSNSSNSGAA